MNLLFIGDIFASPGRRIVADHLKDIIATQNIDLAIANAENAAGGFGITPSIAEDLFAMGLDAAITSGTNGRFTTTSAGSRGSFGRETIRRRPGAASSCCMRATARLAPS
jgi:calcineurin-like phosphoesterase